MKTAFKIASIIFALVLVSCEKAVIVPLNNDSNVENKRSFHVNLTEPVSDDVDGSGITDPNYRNKRITNDVVDGPNITDPKESGNANAKKPKK